MRDGEHRGAAGELKDRRDELEGDRASLAGAAGRHCSRTREPARGAGWLECQEVGGGRRRGRDQGAGEHGASGGRGRQGRTCARPGRADEGARGAGGSGWSRRAGAACRAANHAVGGDRLDRPGDPVGDRLDQGGRRAAGSGRSGRRRAGTPSRGGGRLRRGAPACAVAATARRGCECGRRRPPGAASGAMDAGRMAESFVRQHDLARAIERLEEVVGEPDPDALAEELAGLWDTSCRHRKRPSTRRLRSDRCGNRRRKRPGCATTSSRRERRASRGFSANLLHHRRTPMMSTNPMTPGATDGRRPGALRTPGRRRRRRRLTSRPGNHDRPRPLDREERAHDLVAYGVAAPQVELLNVGEVSSAPANGVARGKTVLSVVNILEERTLKNEPNHVRDDAARRCGTRTPRSS